MAGVFSFSKWIVSLAIAGLVLLALYEKPCQQPFSTNIIFEPKLSPLSLNKDVDDESLCKREYHRVSTDMNEMHVSGNDIRVPGLSEEDYERSVAHVGNRFRLAHFVNKLIQSSSRTVMGENHNLAAENSGPVTVVVCGGSISLGHGVNPGVARYSNLLEGWLNLAYPIFKSNTSSNENESRHRVYNRGSHGADVSFDLRDSGFRGL
jgi:hypothetical protein